VLHVVSFIMKTCLQVSAMFTGWPDLNHMSATEWICKCEIEVPFSSHPLCLEYWIYDICFSLGSSKIESLQLCLVGCYISATLHWRDTVWELIASAEIWWSSSVILVQCVPLPDHKCTQHLYHNGTPSAEKPQGSHIFRYVACN
jgi:hypothetical protein